MANDPLIRSLSVEDWHRLAENGAALPMRVPINGVSMLPLIRRNRDMVTILPRKRDLIRGDVVLFHDPARSRYVLHRVWALSDGRVLTWGDNCVNPDGWMDAGLIWGIATCVERGRRAVSLDTDRARRWGIPLGSCRHRYCRARVRVMRLAGKLPAPVKRALKAILRKNPKKTAEDASV